MLEIVHRHVLMSETGLEFTIQFFEWANSQISCDLIIVIAINICLLRYPVTDEIVIGRPTSVEHTVLSSRLSMLRAHEFFVVMSKAGSKKFFKKYYLLCKLCHPAELSLIPKTTMSISN